MRWTYLVFGLFVCFGGLDLLGACSPGSSQRDPDAQIILLENVRDAGERSRQDALVSRDAAQRDEPAGVDALLRPEPERGVQDNHALEVGFEKAVDAGRDVSEPPGHPDERPALPDLPLRDRGSVPETPIDPNVYVGRSCAVSGVAGTCLWVADCTGDRQPYPGHCPGPSGIQCCVKKGVTPPNKCDETKKPLPNVGLTEAPGQGGCPSGMVRVDKFCIDQYEASLVEVLPGGAIRHWSPFFPPGTAKVKAVSLKGAVPQGYISGREAAAACALAKKRLCTDQEWLRACQGSAGNTYPYGPTRKPGVCNDARALHPAVEYFGSSASWVFSKLGNPCINQLPASLAKTGSHPGCVTGEKVYDMMGNLHEWTSNSGGVFRGGYYVDTYRNGPGCLYRTTAHSTGHWDYSTGFRCCRDLVP